MSVNVKSKGLSVVAEERRELFLANGIFNIRGGGSEDDVLCREDEGCSGFTNVLFIFNDDCVVDEEGLASFFIF